LTRFVLDAALVWARLQQLSANDAVYLDLARRRGSPLVACVPQAPAQFA
jgi:hypothetical protein